MKSWFVSDIHLENLSDRNGVLLLRFLSYLNKNPHQHRLYLLGDIFDFWLSDGAAFVRKFHDLVELLAQFKRQGGQVMYFEGNHDFHVDVFWTKRFGIPVVEDLTYIQLDGLTLRLEHGDFINPNDVKYLKYRARVRHPLIEPIGHLLPGFFWKWLGENQSKKSRKRTANYANQNSEELRLMIRRYAEKAYKEKQFDLIVTGHMHIFDDYSFTVPVIKDGAQQKVRSVNLGTWLEKPRALLIEDGKVQVVDLSDLLQKGD